MAFDALFGVGDAQLGEWVEQGDGGVVHVRRRLSVLEAARVNTVRDIRGTPEERERLVRLSHEVPALSAYLCLIR